MIGSSLQRWLNGLPNIGHTVASFLGVMFIALFRPVEAGVDASLPARAVEGGIVLSDVLNPNLAHLCCLGFTKPESFSAILAREKGIFEFALPWDWARAEAAARPVVGAKQIVRLPWSRVIQAEIVVPGRGDAIECTFDDVTLSPDLLRIKAELADADASARLFDALRRADTPAVLRLKMQSMVATPELALRIRIERSRMVELVEKRFRALGMRLSEEQVAATARELIVEHVVRLESDGRDFGDLQAGESWLAELAIRRVSELLREEVLSPAAAPPGGVKNSPPLFSWDAKKIRTLRSSAGEVSGQYRTSVPLTKTIEVPVKDFKLETHPEAFLDFRNR